MIPHRPITPVHELTRGVHPRLLYTAAEIDALRARLATDTDAQSQLEGIRAEDIPQLAAYAAKEANPLYPVPVLMTRKELEQFYYNVMEASV